MNTSRLAKSAIGVLGLIASLALVGDVWAAGAPSAVTASATAISVSSATLRGSVNPNGVATSWYFEYGTTTSYGSKTTPQTIDGSSAKGVSATVSNLPGGTGVHFRLVASSSAGTSLGGDVGFSTTGAAPTVGTLSANSISTQGARLTGTVNPNGLPTSWYFVYGTSTAYGSRTASQSAGSGTHPVNLSYTISKLAATTGYHFQLIAVNAAGTRGGGDRFFGTVGAPSVQTGTVQSLTPTSGTLTGTLAANGETTRWHFDYGTTTGYGSSTPTQTLAAGSGSTGVSAAVSGLPANSTLHFRLVASSNAGTSASSDASFATPASVALAPAASHVIMGHYLQLRGTTWGGQAGVSVTIQAQPFGESAPAAVATVLTGAGGNWSFPARPQILTTYTASAEGGTSGSVLVAVTPGITLRRISGHRYLAHVGTGATFAGRVVQLQVLSHGRWKTVARERLNPNSSGTFLATLLPKGHSSLRIAFSVNQAGPGYLAGFSRRLTYTRSVASKR